MGPVASRLKAAAQEYALSVISEPGRSGLSAAALRGFLGGLARLYDFGLEAYLFGEALGLRRRDHLPIPVLSVGNLTVGGTGKTPMTQLLCRRFQGDGRRVAVLSRGHGGQGEDVRLVSDADGAVFMTAKEVGDEPVLLAQTLPGVPVLVGKDRRQSGREALRRFGLDVLILDDGFQFWQLGRDLDVVLLDARRPFDNGFPLPRGLLREPKRHLRRAGMVVATRSEGLTPPERSALESEVRCLAPESSLFFAGHHAVGFVPAEDLSAAVRPLLEFAGRRIFAVCAIAQPQSFLQILTRKAGVQIVGRQTWDDHHPFGAAEARSVQAAAAQAGAEALVMTEKDAVKWPRESAAGDLPAFTLRIEMRVEEEAKFMREVRVRLGSHASK